MQTRSLDVFPEDKVGVRYLRAGRTECGRGRQRGDGHLGEGVFISMETQFQEPVVT